MTTTRASERVEIEQVLAFEDSYYQVTLIALDKVVCASNANTRRGANRMARRMLDGWRPRGAKPSRWTVTR